MRSGKHGRGGWHGLRECGDGALRRQRPGRGDEAAGADQAVPHVGGAGEPRAEGAALPAPTPLPNARRTRADVPLLFSRRCSLATSRRSDERCSGRCPSSTTRACRCRSATRACSPTTRSRCKPAAVPVVAAAAGRQAAAAAPLLHQVLRMDAEGRLWRRKVGEAGAARYERVGAAGCLPQQCSRAPPAFGKKPPPVSARGIVKRLSRPRCRESGRASVPLS